MNTFKIKKYTIFLTWISALFLIAGIAGCEETGENEEEEATEGQIYFRWEQNLASPSPTRLWCDIVSGNFKDDNPAVPDFASQGQFYGPCEPGTYSAQYNFDKNDVLRNLLTFTYKLEKPAAGYVRYYTKNLREYNTDLNRCVAMDKVATSLTYYDQEQ